jgi:Uncharacterized protein involved in chromosome partitioning
MLIQEIVHYNSRIAGLNDVQLGWYPHSPFNADLAERYQFTANAEPEKKSSVDVLIAVRDALLNAGESRFVVQATYGHGKTHFALALANFFGKGPDSGEVTNILANIRHAAGDEKTHGIAEFKKARGKFLVVRLDGTAPSSLPAQFVTALTTALHENAETEKAHLPFWSEKAIAFLDRLAGDALREANTFLEAHGQDVPSLKAAVKTNEPAIHDRCSELFRHLHGVAPDFGGEVDVQKAVESAVDDFCGEGKPYAGLIVLFDEFAVFVEEYATHARRGNRAALQKLLDGINSRRGKAAFLAFSQFDPDQVAERVFTRAGRGILGEEEQRGLDDLKRELNRLPPGNRFRLHSSLEMVLDSYLDQDPTRFAQVRAKAPDALAMAADLTVQLLPTRYDLRNGWGPERVDQVLTEGCFPLHPVTTGLLCTLQLQQGTVVRSVLGFVRKVLEEHGGEEVLTTRGPRAEPVPNWVHAAALVDWFGDAITGDLTGQAFSQYQAAVQNAGPALPAVQADTLKAILLQTVAALKPTGQDERAYARLVAVLTGHSEAECDAALRELAARLIIDRDVLKPLYRFFPPGGGTKIKDLDNEVQRRVGSPKLEAADCMRLNETWQKNGRLAPIPVAPLPAMHDADYAAQRWILPRTMCNAANLKRLAQACRIERAGIRLRRGVVIYALAQTEEELRRLRENADTLLQEAFGTDLCLPVILAIPSEPRPNLLLHALKERTLAEMPQHEQNQFGSEAISAARAKYEEAVVQELNLLMSGLELHVPPAFRAVARAAEIASSSQTRLRILLEECYKYAYTGLVPGFKGNLPASTPRLKAAVKEIANLLLFQSKLTEPDRRVNAIANDIYLHYLRDGRPESWTLISVSNHLQEPTQPKVKKGWAHLDDAFAPEKQRVSVKDALLPLLQPPFGYDLNHLTLLFCAWFARNRDQIKIYEAGLPRSIGDFQPDIEKHQLIDALCYLRTDVRIERTDRDAEARRVRVLLDHVRQNRLSAEDARKTIADLRAIAGQAELDSTVAGDAERLADLLAQNLKELTTYETIEQDILSALDAPRSTPHDVARLYKRISTLPALSHIQRGSALSEEQLRARITQKLEARVLERCRTLANLQQLEDFKEQDRELEELAQLAVEHGNASLRTHVVTARRELEKAKKAREDERKDAELREYLRGLRHQSFDAMSIKNLRNLATELESCRPVTPLVQAELGSLRDAVQCALSDLETFAEGMTARLDAIDTPAALEVFRAQLNRQASRYDGSPEEALLAAATERAEGIAGAFAALQRASVPTVTSPEEADALIRGLEEARIQFTPHFSPPQADLFAKAVARVRSLSDGEAQRAIAALEELERRAAADHTNLSDLQRRLEVPLPFLPENQRPRLVALRAQIRERIDADEIEAIVARFLALSSPEHRQHCLARLQSLVADTVGAR